VLRCVEPDLVVVGGVRDVGSDLRRVGPPGRVKPGSEGQHSEDLEHGIEVHPPVQFVGRRAVRQTVMMRPLRSESHTRARSGEASVSLGHRKERYSAS